MHVSFVKFVREGLNIDNIGPMPPPVMLLSDGGHVENLAILPLLKKKLKKIMWWTAVTIPMRRLMEKNY